MFTLDLCYCICGHEGSGGGKGGWEGGRVERRQLVVQGIRIERGVDPESFLPY